MQFDINLETGPLPTTVTVLMIIMAICCLPAGIPVGRRQADSVRQADSMKKKGSGRSTLSILLRQVAGFCIFFFLGGMLTYLISDVWVLFNVQLGALVIRTVAVGMGILGYALVSLSVWKKWRKAAAVFLVILALIWSTLGVNAVYGQYPTVKSLLGKRVYPQLSEKPHRPSVMTVKRWKAMFSHSKSGESLSSRPLSVRKEGIVRIVPIPGKTSHFKARPATIYLPPAALVKNPPRLPLLILMAGQPGDPDRFFAAGKIHKIMDAFAKKNDGLAPIVISPDQLGNPSHDTLCSDTPVYGKVETYLTVDVTRWAVAHLPVQKPGASWGIGGFSMGGTCATHLGPRHHQLYGHIFSVGGEEHETNGSVSSMITRFYRGSREQYDDHVPATAIAKYGQPSQTFLFGNGYYDTLGQKNARIIARAALAKGMSVTAVVAQGTGHDWRTVRTVMNFGVALFCYQTGLSSQPVAIKNFPHVKRMAGIGQ